MTETVLMIIIAISYGGVVNKEAPSLTTIPFTSMKACEEARSKLRVPDSLNVKVTCVKR